MDPQTFIFFGIVGSGKGTQVKKLREYLHDNDKKEQVYIGTGEIFRRIINAAKDDFEKDLAAHIVAGNLVPDEYTNKLVWNELKAQQLSAEKHLVMDGYPRTAAQSRELEKMMDHYHREDIKIVFLELSKEEALERNLLRGRHDDTEEGLRKRFEEYEKKVIPAMGYFEGKPGYQIYKINGAQSIENVHRDIKKVLNL